MTAEKQAGKPVPRMTLPTEEGRLKPEHGKTLPLSPETAAASAAVTQQIAEGKTPKQSDIQAVVGSVSNDLKQAGLLLSNEDVAVLSEKAGKKFSSETSVTADADDLHLPDSTPTIGLQDFETTLSGIMKTYGLEKGKWKLLGGLLAGNEAGWTVLEGLRNRAWTEGLDGMIGNLKQASKDLGLDVTSAFNAQAIRQIAPDTRNSAIWKALKGSWPVWSAVVQWGVEGQIHKFAQKLFMKERAKLEDMVNTRVASSLFMRDFSVFHDQSAGKMMQIINRGKNATVELVAATYFDLMPLLGQIGSYPFGQSLAYGKEYGKFAALTAAAKLPILTYTSLKNAKEQQAINAHELKAWDKINTELTTTLTNLETLRTSGQTETGAQVLKDTLSDKDYVASGGMRQKLSHDKTMDTLFDVMDVGVPMAKNGWEIIRGVQRNEPIEDTLKKAWALFLQSRYAKGEQMMVRQAFSGIMHLYVDKIIPHIQDIRRMEELLGPYDALDVPNGKKELHRVGTDALKSFDISVTDLRYKNILHGVTMDIPQGSFTAIKGPSGIGKTTLLRHIVGLYEPDGGSVQVGGVRNDRIKKYGEHALINHIGYAGQSSEILEGWTLRENLLLGTANVPEARMTAVMRDLGLDHLKDRLDSTVKHYSGGEKRRIGIARALLKDPKILILDEPTAHLDAKSTQQVLDIIADLRKKKPDMTVLAITHDPAFEHIAEQVIDFAAVNKKPDTGGVPTLSDHQVLEAIARADKS